MAPPVRKLREWLLPTRKAVPRCHGGDNRSSLARCSFKSVAGMRATATSRSVRTCGTRLTNGKVSPTAERTAFSYKLRTPDLRVGSATPLASSSARAAGTSRHEAPASPARTWFKRLADARGIEDVKRHLARIELDVVLPFTLELEASVSASKRLALGMSCVKKETKSTRSTSIGRTE